MLLFNLLVFFLTLNEVMVYSEHRNCKIGERLNGKYCVPCEDGTFQDQAAYTQTCIICRKCKEEKASRIKEPCTRFKDTVCECREGFSPDWHSFSTSCICDKGSGLNNGVCSECEEGYFSTTVNSSCQKWKDCKSSGIKEAGTRTSDVVCNENSDGSQTNAPPTSIKKDPLPVSITHLPHEGVQTQKTLSNLTTTPVQHTTVRKPSSPGSYTSTHIGTAILILGIVGLLVLTAMTCKMHISPCWRPKPAVQTKDSLCRRPVEESGDGSEASLKLNIEP